MRRKLNRRGFGFIVAIGMLGLLAFMGLFLIQSSSTEYSQTSLSVYRTMGRQLAEAAADEAAVLLEERFKDKTQSGFFDQLLDQAATSGPRSQNGPMGQNPQKLNDFNNLKDELLQTSALIRYHTSRAGFVIEKVLPTIKDLRPIPQGPLDNTKNYYCPTDRASKNYNEYKPFDNQYSKDWYCTLQIDVTLSLAKQKKTTINYQISRDIKILNVGPIGRNYSFFSILGPFVDTNQSEGIMQSQLRNRLNNRINDNSANEKGRLFLWNAPFQSRVYVHGPAVIDLENSNLVNYPSTDSTYTDKDAGSGATNGPGAFKNPKGLEGPGPNMAYQYENTFYGFSYYPDKNRCFFLKKGFFDEIFGRTETQQDLQDSTAHYGGYFTHDTVAEGGKYPDVDTSFWNRIKSFFEEGASEYFLVGYAAYQKFLPAGPFCRTPWRYIADKPPRERSPFAPNQTEPPPCDFPEKDNRIRLEHRWDPEDEELGKNTGIVSRVNHIVYYPATNNIDHLNMEKYTEFSVNYYNNPDPDSFLGKLGAGVKQIFGGAFNILTLNGQLIGAGIVKIIRRIPAFNKLKELSAEKEEECRNLFPTNFKFQYLKIATRHLANEEQIPRDQNDRWIINGTYWMDSFSVKNNITYVGTGTIIVCRYNKDEPLTISGNVIAARDDRDRPMGHLTIFYYPYDNKLGNELTTDYATSIPKRMLVLKGGVTVEASIFSLCGVKSEDGLNVKYNDFINAGMNPKEPFYKWTSSDGITKLINSSSGQHANVIKGNYVNYYMTLDLQGDDLWVVHDLENPFMFKEDNGRYIAYQEYLDIDENERKNFEKVGHEFFMSPKIQHVGLTGAL